MVEKKYKNQLMVIECSNNECSTRSGKQESENTGEEIPTKRKKPLVKPNETETPTKTEKKDSKKTATKTNAAKIGKTDAKSLKPASMAKNKTQTKSAALKKKPIKK